jgi:hypothetical protein
MVRKGLLLLLVLVVLQFSLGDCFHHSLAAGFSDVPDDYWAASAIADLADRSIIGGYPDGSFRPENPVTRAEFSKMILLAMGFPPRPEISATFPDIMPDDLWSQPFIAGTVVNKLMKGYPDGTFRPRSPITIAEVLTVLVRAQGWTLEDLPEGLTILLRQNDADRPIAAPDWFFQAVGTAARHGLLQFPDHPQVSTAVGSNEFALAANDPATRAQTALFLSRMLAEMPPLTPSPTATGEWKGTIVFYSERDGNPEIYTMNPGGGNLKRLTNDPAQDICPAFSPDGNRIAFSSNRDGNSEIYTMKRDGTDLKRVTNTPENELAPDWSPDGTKILCVSFSSKTWEAGNIFICNADGSDWKQLTDSTGVNERPGYSQDGKKIIFHTNRDGNFEIYTMNADGSNPQRLTNTGANELFPRWSPDGKQIAYSVMTFNPQKAEVHVMNADAGGDRALTQIGGVNEDAVWTTDGKGLVFQSTPDENWNFEVYIMKADGSDPQRLTQNSVFDGWPSWSSK